MCVIHEDRLREAARMAIGSWLWPEGTLSARMQDGGAITRDFLKQWLTYWRVTRGCWHDRRDSLLTRMNHWRPLVLEAEAGDLPALVARISRDLHQHEATRGVQTVMVSKFMHSLRPEHVTPIDSLASDGLQLCTMHLPHQQRYRGTRHDYRAYAEAFRRFLPTITTALTATGIAHELAACLPPAGMSETLFGVRTADKYLMLSGEPARNGQDAG